jgi:hypothetical protein
MIALLLLLPIALLGLLLGMERLERWTDRSSDSELAPEPMGPVGPLHNQ